MRKGRQKGQTKAKSVINDSSIAPFKILVEEDQYVLIDDKDIPRGYYTSLDTVVYRISKIFMANKREEFNLSEFMIDYNKTKDNILDSFKNAK
jgi:hypothetical protein